MEKARVTAPFLDSSTDTFVSVGDVLEVSTARAVELERNGLVQRGKPGPKEQPTDGPAETKEGGEDAKPSKPAGRQPAKR
jgi:hypothetical protein